MDWRTLKFMGINRLGGAVSGGLDSCTVTHWLTSKGFEVLCVTVDLGQPDEANIGDIVERMLACGAHDAIVVPGQEQLAQAGLQLIQAQARYEGGYWNTTGIARPVTATIVMEELARHDIGLLFHGATGRGNDQVRFQTAANTLDPTMEVYAPWRDAEFVSDFPGRTEMIEYCNHHSLPFPKRQSVRYSTDANLLGLTHEAGDLEDISIAPFFVEPGMGRWPWDAEEDGIYVSVRWESGTPIALNGVALGLVEIFEESNRLAGAHGVGIGLHTVENRFVGVKSRGIYEAPGLELLGRTYEFLLQLILDRRAKQLFEDISSFIANQIYQGFWLDLGTSSALAALGPINKLATGTITVKLYRGNVAFVSANDVPYSLYSEDSSMEAQGSFDHTDAEGFNRVLQVAARTFGSKQYPVLREYR